MKKAIIFDLNGVFVVSPRLSDRFSDDYNVPVDDFLPVLKEIMDKVRRPGAEGVYQLFFPYLDRWQINLSEQEFLDYWFKAEKENIDLTNIAKLLKTKGYKLFILSNNFKERADYYAKNFPFLDQIFDKIYYSWQTGFVKPSVDSVQNLLNENGLQPEECLYFDDSEKNIELAQSLGIESYVFDETAVKLLRSL